MEAMQPFSVSKPKASPFNSIKNERASEEQRMIFRFMKNRSEKSQDHQKLMKKMMRKKEEKKTSRNAIYAPRNADKH